jgi:O-glycosyl hydrolase
VSRYKTPLLRASQNSIIQDTHFVASIVRMRDNRVPEGLPPWAGSELGAAVDNAPHCGCGIAASVQSIDYAKEYRLPVRLRLICVAALLLCQTLHGVAVTIQGAATNQVIEGFGVNLNYRGWNGTELQPVVDALIGQAGMPLFRVIYDLTDWEGTNDNADSSVFEWTNYNASYSSAEFTKLWDMMAYLNQRGITNGAFFNFMGWGPSWMMNSDGRSLKTGMESEWAEMITSLLVYARNMMGLQFNLVAPDNEPDLIPEGIHIPTATQYTNALHKLALRLDSAGLGDVGLVGPDLSAGGTTYMPQMMADPVIMAKVKHFGVHGYSSSGAASSGVLAYIANSAYPDRTFWMTEFNVLCTPCEDGTRGTNDWSYARGTAEYLLAHLLNGASGSQVWEAYDSKYAHGAAFNGVSGTNKWSYWGLMGVDDPNAAVKTYTPRKQFYTYAQISKWVRPGAQRISVTGSASPFSPLLAFKHNDSGQVTLVGINTSGSAATLSGTLVSLPAVPHLELYYTSATMNLASGGSVAVNGGAFSATIPANCVFTLAGASNPPSVPSAKAATGVASNRFAANWSSATGATGYRLDVSTNAAFDTSVSGYNDLDTGYLTTWSVAGLETGVTYYYRVRAYNSNGASGSSDAIAVTLINVDPCVAISNSGFESGFSLVAEGGAIANNWTRWEAEPGAAVGYDETAITHGGGHSQRIRVWGTNATAGGVYQRIPVTAGSPATVSIWTYASDTATACSLGVDPAGGTNANSGVTWSAGSTSPAWAQATWTGLPAASYITIYCKVASSDASERNGYFDDATPAPAIGWLQLDVQLNGDALILTWPECPNARLQQASILSPPLNWMTVTNQINVVGGQKTVALTHRESTGLYRLIEP